MASAFFNFNRKRLIAVASQQLLPSVWEGGAFVNDGGLMAYGPSFPDMYNIKTAKALGITLPTTLLARADEIVVRRT